MTQEELWVQLTELQNTYEKNRTQLFREYAYANKIANIGDIVTDHIGSVLVERLKFATGIDKSETVYVGVELKKDLTPTKRGEKEMFIKATLLKQ